MATCRFPFATLPDFHGYNDPSNTKEMGNVPNFHLPVEQNWWHKETWKEIGWSSRFFKDQYFGLEVWMDWTKRQFCPVIFGVCIAF